MAIEHRLSATQTRSWSYTGNFLMSATNPENGTTSYAYGSNNKVSQRTDAKGQVATYTYDGYARLSEVQHYPSGLGGAADPCQQVNYYYDGNNPLSSSYPHYALGLLSAVQYWGGYNPLTSPTCDTVFTEMYNYGVPGSPVGKQLTANRSGAAFSLAATYTYDTEGRMSAETLPNGPLGNHGQSELYFRQYGPSEHHDGRTRDADHHRRRLLRSRERNHRHHRRNGRLGGRIAYQQLLEATDWDKLCERYLRLPLHSKQRQDHLGDRRRLQRRGHHLYLRQFEPSHHGFRPAHLGFPVGPKLQL